MLIGIGLTFFVFPKRDEELRMREKFHEEDEAAASAEDAAEPGVRPVGDAPLTKPVST